MKLPFFDREEKIWVGPLGILAFIIFYMAPNHLMFFTPLSLPMFDFEKEVSFIDWTIWVYISDYLYVAVVFVLLSNKENMNKIFYSQMFLLFITMFIFFFFPTMYPRPIVEYNGFTGAFLKMLHSADSPNNACPSVHVAMTFLGGYGFLKEKKHLFPWFMLWAVLISVSTVTVKQHYVWDVIGGFFMSVIFYYLGNKLIRES